MVRCQITHCHPRRVRTAALNCLEFVVSFTPYFPPPTQYSARSDRISIRPPTGVGVARKISPGSWSSVFRAMTFGSAADPGCRPPRGAACRLRLRAEAHNPGLELQAPLTRTLQLAPRLYIADRSVLIVCNYRGLYGYQSLCWRKAENQLRRVAVRPDIVT